MNREQRQRLAAIDRKGHITAADREALPGVHFCPDWDFMPVCDVCPEYTGCNCTPPVSKRKTRESHGKTA